MRCAESSAGWAENAVIDPFRTVAMAAFGKSSSKEI